MGTKTKAEKVRAKTGMTPSQETELAGWMRLIHPELPNEREYEPSSPVVVNSNETRWRYAPEDGWDYRLSRTQTTITVWTQEQANNVHELLTGVPLGYYPKQRKFSSRSYSSQPTHMYDSTDQWADRIMQIYGHPLYCIAALERQLAWAHEQPELVQKQVDFSEAYQIIELFKQRLDGKSTKCEQSYYGGKPSYRTVDYDIDREMERLGCPNREPAQAPIAASHEPIAD